MNAMVDHLSEQRERWWLPAVAPAIWAAYFTVTYITAAMWCGRFAAPGAAGLAQVIAVYTLVALAGTGAMFVEGFRRRSYQLPERPHAADTPEDRRHFVGFTTMLLAGMSLIATLFVAAAALVAGGCR